MRLEYSYASKRKGERNMMSMRKDVKKMKEIEGG